MDGAQASIHHRIRARTGGIIGVVATIVAAAAVAACSSSAPAASEGAGPAGTEAAQASTDAGGGGPAASRADTAPAMCTLLTTDELKKAVDIDFTDGVLDPVSIGAGMTGRPGGWCTWNPKDKNTLVNVTVVIHDSPDDIGAGFDALKSQPETTQASGIGDEAYLIHGAGAGHNFAVDLKKGPWYIEINMSGLDWQPTDAQMTALGKAVAAHLP